MISLVKAFMLTDMNINCNPLHWAHQRQWSIELTIFEEVCFDNFITAPLCWLPPAYLVKAAVYDYPLKKGLQKYVHDIQYNGLLSKYLSIWIPAQSVSFSVIPEHLRVVFMASVSFFWFILFSTVASASDADESSWGLWFLWWFEMIVESCEVVVSIDMRSEWSNLRYQRKLSMFC